LPPLTRKKCARSADSLRRTACNCGRESGTTTWAAGIGSPYLTAVAFQRGAFCSASMPSTVHHRSFGLVVR